MPRLLHLFPLTSLATMSGARPAFAHASDQSFVLLLPTHLYIGGGVAVVVLTVLVIALMTPDQVSALFRPIALRRTGPPRGRTVASCLACLALFALIWLGLAGTRDPTRNALPVAVWALFWGVFVLLTGALGRLWSWVNPWTGPLTLARAAGLRPIAQLGATVGYWPALLSFAGFAVLLLIHPAASDPDVLASFVIAYWALHFVLGLTLGPRWLRRGEGFGVLLAAYATLSPVSRWKGRWRVGLPGWQIVARPAPDTGLALFLIALLAVGSFDGLYKTFFWFSLTGQNPLAFEGRSTVILPNSLGLILALPALALAFAACIGLGQRWARVATGTLRAVCAFAPALLPIAFAYHLAHYLPTLLIALQSVPIVLNDPLGNRSDLWGLGHGQVSAGLFNRLDTVRIIWLTQAGAVVAGHVTAILISHALALRLYGDHGRAARAGAPLTLFMIGYTLFGLWLLASPQAG